MKFIRKRVQNPEEAIAMALNEAGMGDMSTSVTELFTSVIDTMALGAEVDRRIATAIKGRYRGKPVWKSKWWCVPIPVLTFEARDVPQLKIEVRMHMVADVEVETVDACYSVTLVEMLGKPATLVMPMVFLRAVLDDDLGRFVILARGGGRTTWEMPGLKPVELPDDFLSHLSDTLKRKSVDRWLEDFGRQGWSVMSLVVGSLTGLQYMDKAAAPPLSKQRWTNEQLISTLESLVYQGSEARDMVIRATPYLRADQTLEEAVRVILQNEAKGG
ncbi:hypothetical protein M1O56_04005 [Dehalococcoidia bacterium]|nr:hypothetical protein [Dehalococcoidia bacterium]